MLKPVNIDDIKYKNICIIGKRCSGKTTLWHDILTKIAQKEKIDIIRISKIGKKLKNIWEDV